MNNGIHSTLLDANDYFQNRILPTPGASAPTRLNDNGHLVIADPVARAGTVLLVETALVCVPVLRRMPNPEMFETFMAIGASADSNALYEDDAAAEEGGQDQDKEDKDKDKDPLRSALHRLLKLRFPRREEKAKAFLAELLASQGATEDLATASLRILKTAVVKLLARPLQFGLTGIVYARGIFGGNLARVCHSCEPNAAVVGHGRHLILYALRDIAQGERVTVTIMEDLPCYPFQSRRKLLLDSIKTYCECSRCLRELDELTPPMATIQLVAKVQDWQKLCYAQVPELRGTGGTLLALKPNARAKTYRLCAAFLEQNGNSFLKDAHLARPMVVKTLARLLVPLDQNAFAVSEELEAWCLLYQRAFPLFMDALKRNDNGNANENHGEVHIWQASLFWFVIICRALVKNGSAASEKIEALLPNIPPVGQGPSALIANFVLAQYLTFPLGGYVTVARQSPVPEDC